MSGHQSLSDDELNSLFREGRAQSFLLIYDHYAPLLLKYAGSRLRDIDDAADLVHDVFLKAWIMRGQVRSLKPYLYTLLRHRLIDHVRKNASREGYVDMLRSLSAEPVFNMETELEAKDLQQFIHRAAGHLPPRTREIFRLRSIDHLTIRQISLRLKISEQTVKNQLSNAHNLLRKAMVRVHLLLLLDFFTG